MWKSDGFAFEWDWIHIESTRTKEGWIGEIAFETLLINIIYCNVSGIYPYALCTYPSGAIHTKIWRCIIKKYIYNSNIHLFESLKEFSSILNGEQPQFKDR